MSEPETPTAVIEVTCPSTKRHERDVVGCGHVFTAAPDDEGLFDCPNCGIWFNPKTCNAPVENA